MRWAEPLTDFPRFLYIPWRMSGGALLYQDVVCNYGPLPLVVQAGAFRLFGPGLDVIVWLNIAVTGGIIALVWGIFGRIGDRLSGWLCGVVFIVVFALPFYSENDVSLFNYIAPYCSQATWGIGGVLLTVYALVRHANQSRRRWLVVGGLGLGIAFLDKPELLLAALGVLGMYLGLTFLQIWRQGGVDGGIKQAVLKLAGGLGLVLAGFLAAYLPVFFFFASEGGLAYGFRAANWTLRVFYDPAYIQSAHTTFQREAQGFDHPWANGLTHLEWGVMTLLFCAVVGWAGRGWLKAQAANLASEGFAAIIMAAIFLIFLFTNWFFIGHALLVPTALFFFFTAGAALRRAWRGQVTTGRQAGLALVSAVAMLLVARIVLNVNITVYGFFLTVPAMLLLVHGLIYELPRRFGSKAKPNGLLQVTLALLVLTATGLLGQNSLAGYALRVYPVGTGRDRFYTFTPNVYNNGEVLNLIVDAMQKYFSKVQTVMAFPESMAINYQLRKIDPIPDMQFTPDVLKMAGLDNVLAKLNSHAPDAVILYARDMKEYHQKYFGADEESGKTLLEWIAKNYTPAYFYGKSPYCATGHEIDIFLRKDLVRSPAPGVPGGPFQPISQ